MRPRLITGTLVGSTNPLRKIKARRLIVKVVYNFKHKIVKEQVTDVRTYIEQ